MVLYILTFTFLDSILKHDVKLQSSITREVVYLFTCRRPDKNKIFKG
jgi:hypothetical protein